MRLRCPNIRSLYVSPCALIIVKAIEQSSQIKLDHLVIADKIPRRYLQNKAATTTATTATITTGLKTLELHASTADPFLSRLIFTPCDLTRIICDNSNNLQVLSITCAMEHQNKLHNVISNSSNWDLIFKASFNNLRRLHCVIPNDKGPQFAKV